MKISVITLFPQMFSSVFSESIIKRAQDKKLVEIKFVNLRDFGIGKHKIVDDTPYGGGRGMILRIDVLKKALDETRENINSEKAFLLTAQGRQFDQKVATELADIEHLILVCGHYEGFDERVKKYVDGEISVGDYILTGGEIPAMLIIDSVARLIKGVIKEESSKYESFTPFLEHPQYTKPIEFDGEKVPEVLTSGNHKKIEEWKNTQSIVVTKKLRPDLIEKG